MMKQPPTLVESKILRGGSDASSGFDDLRGPSPAFSGLKKEEGARGSHQIFFSSSIEE
jgi:hypothetical protein